MLRRSFALWGSGLWLAACGQAAKPPAEAPVQAPPPVAATGAEGKTERDWDQGVAWPPFAKGTELTCKALAQATDALWQYVRLSCEGAGPPGRSSGIAHDQVVHAPAGDGWVLADWSEHSSIVRFPRNALPPGGELRLKMYSFASRALNAGDDDDTELAPPRDVVAHEAHALLSRTSPTDAALPASFARSLRMHLAGPGYQPNTSAFSAFAQARLESMEPKPKPTRAVTGARGTRRRDPNEMQPTDGELGHLLRNYTGRSAVEDSLQSRRGLRLREDKPQARTLGPDKLAQLAHTPRDYAALLRALPGAPKAVMSPLADVIPHDALVFEFSSAADLAGLPAELEARFGVLVHAAEGTPSADDLLGAYRTQLALELDGLAKTFGHLAFKRAAVVLSDPYLREGTDVSVLFETESDTLLREVLAKHLASTAARLGTLSTRTLVVEGVSCTLHESADGSVRRIELPLAPHVLALSNSPGAAARLVRAAAGKARRLSESADYRYARSLAPHDTKGERAFAFFGDAAVERINGGPARIVEARRSRAESELASVNYAALLHGWMTGRAPQSTPEMLKAGWLRATDLKHQDGQVISWSPERGAQSAWGRVGHLTPLVDVPAGTFSKEEASAYADFARQYDGITEGRLDPTSFRIARTEVPGRWETELRVLPLSTAGEYRRGMGGMLQNGLLRGGSFVPGATQSPLAFSMALGGIGEARSLARMFLGSEANDALQVVGDWGALGTDDGAVIWESALEHGEVLTRLPRSKRPHFKLDTDVGRIPAWAMMQLRSRIAFKALTTALKAQLETRAQDGGRDDVRWEVTTPYKGEEVQKVTLKDGEVYASLYYATAKDVLVAALRRDVLEARIDDVLEGRAPRSVESHEGATPRRTAGQSVDFAPAKGSAMRRALYALLDKQASNAHARACAAVEVLGRGLGAEYTGEAAAKRALALRHLGYAPASSDGGELKWEGGQCHDAVFGTREAPRWPDARDATPLHAALDGLLGAHIETSLVPRASEVELLVRMRLDTGP